MVALDAEATLTYPKANLISVCVGKHECSLVAKVGVAWCVHTCVHVWVDFVCVCVCVCVRACGVVCACAHVHAMCV